MPDTRQLLSLLIGFTRRELTVRFAGSALGIAWALIGPALLLGIYSLVFGRLLQQQANLGTSSYTLFVAIGLWPWMMFSDGVMRGMSSLQNNNSLIKKVAFPPIILVIAAVSAAFLQHLMGYLVVLSLLAMAGANLRIDGIPFSLMYILMLYFFTLSVASFLAALHVFLRDTEQIVAPTLMMLHFLTPILYPLAMIPPVYRTILAANPIATIVTGIRENLLNGATLQAADLTYFVFALATLFAGWLFFERLSPYFEDFL